VNHSNDAASSVIDQTLQSREANEFEIEKERRGQADSDIGEGWSLTCWQKLRFFLK